MCELILNKRERELIKVQADAALKIIITMRRFDLVKNPVGASEVFSVWGFAKKYGVKFNDDKK